MIASGMVPPTIRLKTKYKGSTILLTYSIVSHQYTKPAASTELVAEDHLFWPQKDFRLVFMDHELPENMNPKMDNM